MSAWEKFIRIVFTLEGRLGRRRYAAYWIKCFYPLAVMMILDFLATNFFDWQTAFPNLYTAFLVSELLIFWFFIFCDVLLMIRRLHDLNKRGTWLLLPIAIIISEPSFSWLLVFLFGSWLTWVKGTDGANRFGEPPDDD